MTLTAKELWRRWYAPETGDIVLWKPRGEGRNPFSDHTYEVLDVDGDRLFLRTREFPRDREGWHESMTDLGQFFVLESAEERVAKELMEKEEGETR